LISFDARGDSGKVKNIIIMLGDGMGAAHRTAARLVRYGVKAGTPQGWLAMDNFPGTGFVTTHSLDSIVTDSAPGMACYSTGNHANNEQEGVFPAHVTNPFYAPRVEYMSEYLHRKEGKSLGLVTTADVEDATPAANAVHTKDRNAGMGICDQYLDESDELNAREYGTGLTVLMGGGRRWFLPKGQFGSSRDLSKADRPIDYDKLPGDMRKAWNLPEKAAGALDPDRNLLKDFKDAGFIYVDTFSTGPDALNNVGTPNKLLGLFAYGNMNVALDKIDGRRYQKLSEREKLSRTTPLVVKDYHEEDQPMLDEMTKAALRVLNKKDRNEKGFVLMVEGAHIDKQSHMMDTDRMIDEVIEFDKAVDEAYKFAKDNGDTIVIVLADHECSGLSLFGAFTDRINLYDEAKFPEYNILDDGYPETFDSNGKNGKVVAGFGANADRYESWRQKSLPVIDTLLPDDLRAELRKKGYADSPYQRKDPLGFLISGQVGKGYKDNGTAVHTATDVPISSYSGKSDVYQLFYGVHENTSIFFKLMCATLGGFKQAEICSPKR
jgi:alkaline phosphatase